MSDCVQRGRLAQPEGSLSAPDAREAPRRPGGGSAPFDLVAVATSAGGLAALTAVLAPLPADFPAAVVVVQHLWRGSGSMLAPILDRRTRLRVRQGTPGARLVAGVIHVAPPDWHLRVSERQTLRLSQEAPVHFARPAADPLFQSVAAVFGRRAIGVVLTGGGVDGVDGVRAIKAAGGAVISQHPEGCHCPQMPQAALRTGCVDVALALPAIAPALVALLTVPGAAQFFGIPHRCRPPLPHPTASC